MPNRKKHLTKKNRLINSGDRGQEFRKRSYTSLIRTFFFLLILVFSVALISYTKNFYKAYRDTKFDDIAHIRSRDHKDESIERTLLVFESKDSNQDHILSIAMVIVNRENATALMIDIPGWVYFDQGTYDELPRFLQVRDIRYASAIAPGNAYSNSVSISSDLFAIVPDRYIWISSDTTKLLRSEFDIEINDDGENNLSSLNNLFNFTSLIRHQSLFPKLSETIYSNLSLVQISSMFSYIKGLKKDSAITYISLSNESFHKDEILATGSKATFVNYYKLDSEIGNHFKTVRSREVEKEQVKVEILNGSEVTGMGYSYSRRVSNAGCKVIRIDNSKDPFEKSTIYISDSKKFSNSLEVVKSLIDGEVVIINSRPDFLSSGDIVVVIGKSINADISTYPL